MVSFLVARSDPRAPRRGWRAECGARPGAQRGSLAGREGRRLASMAPELASPVCFVEARGPPPPTTAGLTSGTSLLPSPLRCRNRVSGKDPQRPGSSLPQARMSNYVNDMWPGSPLQSPAASGGSSRLSSATRSRSSRSSRSRSSGSSRWSSSSGSRLRRRSRSRSRSRRRHQRKYRRYSRSYSRSRSRSRSRRYRERHYGSSRRYRSPSPDRSRSRSRSRGRSYYRRAYAVTRGRRYYGFGRTVYPEEHGSWRGRSRSRSRSRSPTPFRLSEKGESAASVSPAPFRACADGTRGCGVGFSYFVFFGA